MGWIKAVAAATGVTLNRGDVHDMAERRTGSGVITAAVVITVRRQY
jgi:hypothetical protein